MRCEICDDTRLISIPAELREGSVKRCPHCAGVKTHLDPMADKYGVVGCCCQGCELARQSDSFRRYMDMRREKAEADTHLAPEVTPEPETPFDDKGKL